MNPPFDISFEVEALKKACTREELAQLVCMLTAELEQPSEQDEQAKETPEEA